MTKEQEAENTAQENNEASLEAAKQERQQESDKKRDITVDHDGKFYIVKGEGDGKPMYESEDCTATIEFAQKVAEEHNVDVIITDRVKEAESRQKEENERKENDQEGERKEEPKDDRKEEERREERGRRRGERYEERETEGPRNVILEDDGRYYIVRNEGDHAKLYESKDRTATLDFARKMAKDHEVDLIVLDRDKRVDFEEKHSNGKNE